MQIKIVRRCLSVAKRTVKRIQQKQKKPLLCNWSKQNNLQFEQYTSLVKKNVETEYKASILPVELEQGFKWCGAQLEKNTLWGIANGMEAFLTFDIKNEIASYCGKVGIQSFKWTGGCIYNGKLYAFPRSANDFVKIELDTKSVERIPLTFLYRNEHHYGGICTKEGIVYQPPRNTDHILVTDLNTMKSKKIQLYHSIFRIRLRYCGSIVHPNGCAYFFPESKDRIIKLNLKTEEWCWIGSEISTMVFEAKVATDGNIYGYSAYGAGMLKIDVEHDICEMIHKEIYFGAYGTKLGINGNLYSIPGDGENVWEYDPKKDALNMIFKFPKDSNGKAKFAGGVTGDSGDIYAVPAFSREGILKIQPKQINSQIIPRNIYDTFFLDNY